MLRTNPEVKGWLNTVGTFAPSMRAQWGRGGASTATVTTSKEDAGVEKKNNPNIVVAAAAGGDGDEDMDNLFGDDEDGADTGAEEKKASGGPSRAEQMAAAKASKDKTKKVDRCVRQRRVFWFGVFVWNHCLSVHHFAGLAYVECASGLHREMVQLAAAGRGMGASPPVEAA